MACMERGRLAGIWPCSPCDVPVTLLSPLTPMKKGANALYIGVLPPLHPFPQISYDQLALNKERQNKSPCVPVCRKSSVSSMSLCSHVISQSGSMWHSH